MLFPAGTIIILGLKIETGEVFSQLLLETVPTGNMSFSFCLHCTVWYIAVLVPQAGIKTQPLAVEAQRPNQWSPREVPGSVSSAASKAE